MERKEHAKKKIYKVEPLRNKKDITDMKKMLKIQGQDSLSTNKVGSRNAMLFDFGINTGLRVSDIVNLKVKTVKNKDRFTIREKKTGKVRTVYIKNIKRELDDYIDKMKLNDDDWLFPSRKHGYHVSNSQVYRALVKAGKLIKHQDIGTHTMRKTFGYWFIKNGGSIATLMVIFNHSSEAITKRYIGIQQENIEDSLKNFHL